MAAWSETVRITAPSSGMKTACEPPWMHFFAHSACDSDRATPLLAQNWSAIHPDQALMGWVSVTFSRKGPRRFPTTVAATLESPRKRRMNSAALLLPDASKARNRWSSVNRPYPEAEHRSDV